MRIIIENVKPEINSGKFPIKRVVGEAVAVQADIFADGHDEIAANILYRKAGDKRWQSLPMKALGNDRWEGVFKVEELGVYYYTIQASIDRFQTWQRDLKKKFEASHDVRIDLMMGSKLIEKAAYRATGDDAEKLRTIAKSLKNKNEIPDVVSLALSEDVSMLMKAYPDERSLETLDKELVVIVDRKKSLFSSWYELFPRSCSLEAGRHGNFKDCERLFPEIARIGFDVLYLPPIHPIAKTNRKGKNNSPSAEPGDPGSPWAIGSDEGGHKSIHPQLGTMEEFEHFLNKAKNYGMEIAMDLAFQCSVDHPYVREHPEWFLWRPDGSIQYAENPPKKYEDVVSFNFDIENWRELWEELKSIVTFWIEKGVRIFRVDNPHTKPFAFWRWLIKEIRWDHPDVIFLAEAFTRPKVMYELAKVGFTQSYTYFTWRNTKWEFIDYLTELTQTDVGEYFRPNFWPNTPDILPQHLQNGGRPAFIIRLLLASTLSSNYGIYGPAFELCVAEGMPGKEEYLNSEKYEIKSWDREKPGNIIDLIAKVNQIRQENPALQTTWNLEFHEVNNENLICYAKATEDLLNVLLIVVNLDPFHKQSGQVRVPIYELGIALDSPYLVHDLLSGNKYIWRGEWNYVELNPQLMPAHIFRVYRSVDREEDFGDMK
ncbi:MAG: alpha-1,4-glucan--maltose-1-phosphate maltosyltransferase [Methanobacteriota archaeon]